MAVEATLRFQLPSTVGTRAERTDTLVISNDDSLLIELGPLIGDRYRIHTIDTPASIAEQVETACWIGIVDVDSQASARGAVSDLEMRHPGCPLIVIAARPEDWVDSIERGAVLAAIGRDEVASGRLGETLLAAEGRLRVASVEQHDATWLIARPDPFEINPPRRGSAWAAAAMLLFGLGAAGVWLHHRLAPAMLTSINGAIEAPGGARTSDAAPIALDARPAWPSATTSPLSVQQQSIPELLSAARVAFRAQKSLPPRPDSPLRGDSALELYAQVLRREPQSDEALEGVRRLLIIGRSRIMTDVASGSLDDATRLLGVFTAAGVDAADLRPLESVISAARPKLLMQRAALNIDAGDFTTADLLLSEAVASGADVSTVSALRTQEGARKLELQLAALASQVSAAIQAGALLPPTMDNARTLLTTMRSIGGNHPLTLKAEQELQAALVQAGEQATRAALFDLAQRDLNAVAEIGSYAPLSEARRQLQAAKDAAARTTATPAAAIPQAEPVAVSTAASAPAAPPSPSLASPRSYIDARPTRDLIVKYPPGVSANGSVVLEFTLSANGSARNVTVVESDPPGVFELTAIRAVLRGRYSTDELVNRQPTRARIKLRFNYTG